MRFLVALVLTACTTLPPATVVPATRCAALAPTCGGSAWQAWCESTCLPEVARANACRDGDLCALCGDGDDLYTFTTGCEPTQRRCDDTNPCPLGQSTWTGRGGVCLPSEPCANDTLCAPLGRACVTTLGVASCGRCLDDRVERNGACVDGPVAYVGPYRVGRDHFSVWDGTGYRHLFLRGMNVGGSRPGESADDVSLTQSDWTRWITIWAEAGLNVVHVYRLHAPALYDALLAWNEASPDRPMYLLQGVYGQEPSAPDTDLAPAGAALDDEIAHAIDCVHGHCDGYPDASPWLLGWLIGREIGPREILATDAAHPDIHGYEGEALSIRDATPSAAWVVERMDRAILVERTRYGTERPMAHILWTALDPLTHRTERASSETDIATVDLAGVDATRAPAGHFLSYHAYPYDPGFMSEDVDYLWCSDEVGPNSYRAYLRELRAHHHDQAVLIAEFGVPTSAAPAHTTPSGMWQGGLDEHEQGASAARMLDNIADVGAAGGIWFQWEDGWWKSAWTAAGRAFPASRFPLWHDRLDAEQAFGLLAFEPEMSAPIAIVSPTERVLDVRASSSAEIVRFEITLDRPLALGESIEIGLDVLDRQRGEPTLPSGRALDRSRAELAITLTSPEARARVTPCLDLSRMLDDVSFVPATRDGGCGGWAELRWAIEDAHVRPSDECYVPREVFDLGALRVREASAPSSRLDMVVIDGSVVRIDLPWNLLFVADPSTRAVIDDDASTPDRDATPSDGIVLSIGIGDELVETSAYVWPTWQAAPATSERLKDGAETFFAYTRAMPRWLD